MTMTDDEIKALEAEAAGEEAPAKAATSVSSGSDSFGNAFEAAFANVEWQPGN